MSITQDSSSPSWKVLWIFDPDGVHDSFGYTVGLADLGLPELYMSERPSAGDDPDDPWRFSGPDTHGLLNDFAARLIAGELRVGDEFTEDSDAGATKVTFRLDPPVAPDQVEAYQAAVEALVVPVRWALQRPPEGPPVPLTESYASMVATSVIAAIGDLDLSQLPAQWRPTAAPSFEVDQPFGPLTAFVQTTAALVVSATDEQLAEFLNLASLARHGYGPARVIGTAIARARAAGRTRAMRTVLTEVPALVDVVVGPDTQAPRWREVVKLVFGPVDDDPSDRSEALRRELVQALRALLATQLLNDVAGVELDIAGRGPWWWSFSGTSVAPDAAWHAPQPALDEMRRLLGSLSATQLLGIAQAHLQAQDDVDGESSRYNRVADWLYAQMITSATGIPRLRELLADTAAAAHVESLETDEVASAHLQTAVATMTSALACASKLHPRGQQAVVETFGNHLPSLRDRLSGAGERPDPGLA